MSEIILAILERSRNHRITMIGNVDFKDCTFRGKLQDGREFAVEDGKIEIDPDYGKRELDLGD